MRVLLDGQITGNDGIGRYTRCLTGALEAEGADNDLGIHVAPPAGVPRYSLAEGDHLLEQVRRRDADLLHVLDYRVPLRDSTVPVVATVHDIRLRAASHCYSDSGFTARYGSENMDHLITAVHVLRETAPWPPGLGREPSSWHEEFIGRMLCRTAATATAIISPTHAVAAELRRVTALSPPVHVSPYGVDHLHRSTFHAVADEVSADRYLLYVGQARVHKGVPALLTAFARSGLAEKGLRLALVGGDFAPGTVEAARAASVDGVLPIGQVTDTELATWYGNAVALVHLSDHEGFGLTPAEALSFGAPTVAADIPVLREVLGPHAVYVDPRATDQVAAALRKLARHPATSADRAARISWADRYRWVRHAHRILAVYREVLS